MLVWCDILCHLCLSLFGHVARLDPGVPAHDALRLMVDTYEGRKAMASDATLMKLIRLLQHSVYVSEVIY